MDYLPEVDHELNAIMKILKEYYSRTDTFT